MLRSKTPLQDGVLVPNTKSPTTPIHFREVQMQKDTEILWFKASPFKGIINKNFHD
ncbi:DUF2887 domain-containing protein [Okeania sp. KiyG1]|uniref:DUF2887 domain-containing protein n=1 Tax=Okeania sp. KiyG1 TaxID=2720165 RepID=UPI0035C8F70D